MKASLKCKACGKPLFPHPRNVARQRYCLDPACQRARRKQSQRQRRAQARRGTGQSEVGAGMVLGLEAAVKPCEAVLSKVHPAIIGLISQFIDSTSQEEILVFIRRCIARGHDILATPSTRDTGKRCISKPQVNTPAQTGLRAA